jgi:hypothetical protein
VIASIDAVTYTEGLEIIHGEFIAIEVEESILKHASVAVSVSRRKSLVSHFPCVYLAQRRDVRENESVTVVPLGVLGVKPHEPVEEDVCDRSHAPETHSVSVPSQ